MTGIVLLDLEQQHALQQSSGRRDQPTTPSASSTRRRQQSDSTTTISNGSDDHCRSVAPLGGSAGRPSVATLGSSPRTNFRTQARNVPQPLDVESIQEEGAGPDPSTFGDATCDESFDGKVTKAKESQDLSMKLIVVGVVVGFVIGIILQAVKVSPIVGQWIQLPCTLFLRALSCVVVPYVFCSVAVAIGDIVYVGKISIVGYQTAKIFVIFWLATTIMGIGIALSFRPLFHTGFVESVKPANAIGFDCANRQLLAMQSDGTVACLTNGNQTEVIPTFVVTDLAQTFATKPSGVASPPSLDEMLRNMILYVVPPNLILAFTKDELLSIVIGAMVLGAISGRNYFNKTRRVNYLFVTLLQLRDAFFLMLEWTIALTPVALVSFIAGVMATDMSVFNATHLIYYVFAVVIGTGLQMLVVAPAIVFVMTQCNPYSHMKQMVRAYVFAFACSSSVATAPVSLSCIKRARVCSQSLSNFAISIGVCANASAMGFCVPIGVLFLAESVGTDSELTALRLIGLFGLTLVSCVATPPIPGATLANVSIVYSVLFGVEEMPPVYLSLVAVDFLVDRFATVCNVNDDIMAVKIIAENTDETVVQEELGERSL